MSQQSDMVAKIELKPNPDFECVRCGACCRNYPVTEEEKTRLYSLANEEQKVKLDKQLKLQKNGYWLVLSWCPFLDKGDYDNGILASCTIHTQRPQACRDFPFPGVDNYPACRQYFDGILPSNLILKSEIEIR